jgi:hypothetical protein
MLKKIMLSLVMMGLLLVVPAMAQDHSKFDKFTFSAGAGVTAPLNPTAHYTGVSGNFVVGAGYKLSPKSSINGEFMWSGLPGDVFTVQPTLMPELKSNVYFLGANYRYQIDRIRGSAFGVYAIGGGGWYDRYMSLVKNASASAVGTPCLPIYTWWDYTCSGGVVVSDTIARKGNHAGGINAGFGITFSLGHSFKFFTEARYHYAFNSNVATTIMPVTLGIRFN